MRDYYPREYESLAKEVALDPIAESDVQHMRELMQKYGDPLHDADQADYEYFYWLVNKFKVWKAQNPGSILF